MAIEMEAGAGPPQNTLAPALSGSFFAGQILACGTGNWSGSPTSFEYRWQNEGVDNGDTDNQYTSISGDDGKRVRCMVRARNTAGWSDWTGSGELYIIQSAQWLDASDIATITQTGGSVSAWNDKSGNGRNPAQSTGSLQPITATRTINGLNVLEHYAGRNLIQPSSMHSVPAGNNTVLMLLALDNTTSDQRPFIGAGNAQASRWGFMFNQSAGQFQVVNHTDFIPAGGPVTFNTAPHIVGLRRVGGTVSAIYDGVIAGSAAATNFTAFSATIGARATSGLNGLSGVIGEVVVAARALTNNELNQLGQWLSNKWGVAWTNIS